MGNSNSSNSTSSTTTTPPVTLPRQRVLHGDGRRSCIVIGATGATGKELIYQLCRSPEWGRIKIIHRRQLDLSTLHTSILPKSTDKSPAIALSDVESSKVTQFITELDNLLNDDVIEQFKGYDICFCVLGTKRAVAGSAAKYKLIDLTYPSNTAIAARRANVKQFTFLSTTGANANIWANDWNVMHPFLYFQTKGLAENAIIKERFLRTSIMRPGVFEKNDKKGFGKFSAMVSDTIHIRDLAKVLIMDAESNDLGQYKDKDEKENENENEQDKNVDNNNNNNGDNNEDKGDDNVEDNKDEKDESNDKDETKSEEIGDNNDDKQVKQVSGQNDEKGDVQDIVIYEKKIILEMAGMELYENNNDNDDNNNEVVSNTSGQDDQKKEDDANSDKVKDENNGNEAVEDNNNNNNNDGEVQVKPEDKVLDQDVDGDVKPVGNGVDAGIEENDDNGDVDQNEE